MFYEGKVHIYFLLLSSVISYVSFLLRLSLSLSGLLSQSWCRQAFLEIEFGGYIFHLVGAFVSPASLVLRVLITNTSAHSGHVQ